MAIILFTRKSEFLCGNRDDILKQDNHQNKLTTCLFMQSLLSK